MNKELEQAAERIADILREALAEGQKEIHSRAQVAFGFEFHIANLPAVIEAKAQEYSRLQQQLATSIAERDALHKNCIKQYDWEELRAKNQSLTTLCAELVEALEEVIAACKAEPKMNNHKYDGLGIKANKALAHYAELLKKKDL